MIGDTAAPRPQDYSFEHGLLGSLHELALWCCTIAIGLPVMAVSGALLGGHQFFAMRDYEAPSQPVLAFVLTSFILVPMLALAGVISGVIVSLGLVRTPDPAPVRLWRAAFLVAAGALAVLVAVTYDIYFVPDLTA